MTSFTYDAAGQMLSTTDPLGHVTSFAYDTLGDQVSVTEPDPDGAGPLLAAQTTATYDAVGNLASTSDRLGHMKLVLYDHLNRPTRQFDANFGATSFSYDAAGNRTSLTDPAGNATTFNHDSLNRLTSETNQLNKTRTYGYDANGNLTSELDRDGRLRNFVYDNLDRRTDEKWMSGSTVARDITYASDAAGQLTSTSDPSSTYAYGYDNLGRQTSVDNLGTPNMPHVVLASGYDGLGNRTSLAATVGSTNDFQNAYTYDALSRLTKETQAGVSGGNGVAAKRVDFTYNAASQPGAITRYSDLAGTSQVVTSTYGFDQAGRLTSLTHAHAATTIAGYAWTYDAANQPLTFSNSAHTTENTTYSYDNAGQVTGATATSETYSYDANGNRTNTGYSTATNNQLSSDGTFTYTYDDAGNRTGRTRISNAAASDYRVAYAWDYRNRLIDVTFFDNSNAQTKHVGYTYDMFNHLVGRSLQVGSAAATAQTFTFDGDEMKLAFDGSGAVSHRYLWGPAVDQLFADEKITTVGAAGSISWTLGDNQNTIRDTIDSSGTVLDHITYSSFGQPLSHTAAATDLAFGYTGRYFDKDTGLQWNLNRWYDPTTGRWISEDPIQFKGGDSNLRKYSHNSPTSFTDPSGFDSIEIIGDKVYEDNWFAHEELIGTLSADKNHVIRGSRSQPINDVRAQVRLGYIGGWDAWFRVHGKKQCAGMAAPFGSGGSAGGQDKQPEASSGKDPGTWKPDDISQGRNYPTKIRKHIDQVRNRLSTRESIPSPGQGGLERVWEIIRARVAQGGGRATTFGGESAVAFEDGGVTYIFRTSGQFWTILAN